MKRRVATSGKAAKQGSSKKAKAGSPTRRVRERAQSIAKSQERLSEALPCLPIGLAAARGTISPFISNILAQLNPHGVVQRQVARAVVESGETPDEIARSLQQAQAEGQGNFTVADALGNAGQRLLSCTARAPGQGRANVVNFLENRQAGQGRRVASALSEGFEAPETGAQVERRLTQARDEAANAEYGAIRKDAGPVDLTRAIARIR